MSKVREKILYFFAFLPYIHIPFAVYQIIYLESTRPSALTGNPIILSGISIFSLAASYDLYERKKDWLFLYNAFLSVVCLLITVTWAGYLALLFYIARFVYVESKRKV